jgi:hypothetical protein
LGSITGRAPFRRLNRIGQLSDTDIMRINRAVLVFLGMAGGA